MTIVEPPRGSEMTREAEVLPLVAQRLTNVQIAETLLIPVHRGEPRVGAVAQVRAAPTGAASPAPPRAS